LFGAEFEVLSLLPFTAKILLGREISSHLWQPPPKDIRWEPPGPSTCERGGMSVLGARFNDLGGLTRKRAPQIHAPSVVSTSEASFCSPRSALDFEDVRDPAPGTRRPQLVALGMMCGSAGRREPANDVRPAESGPKISRVFRGTDIGPEISRVFRDALAQFPTRGCPLSLKSGLLFALGKN
jgi:hypothetical protein